MCGESSLAPAQTTLCQEMPTTCCSCCSLKCKRTRAQQAAGYWAPLFSKSPSWHHQSAACASDCEALAYLLLCCGLQPLSVSTLPRCPSWLLHTLQHLAATGRGCAQPPPAGITGAQRPHAAAAGGAPALPQGTPTPRCLIPSLLLPLPSPPLIIIVGTACLTGTCLVGGACAHACNTASLC